MARSAADIAALYTELTTDPNTLGLVAPPTIDDVGNADKLNEVLCDEDVKQALEEGRLDKVKEKLERVFGKEPVLVDEESQELISAIDDLEKVDEETALKMAGEKAKKITEESKEKETE